MKIILIIGAIFLLIGCCPTKNCDSYKKQISTCNIEKSNLKAHINELKFENISLMDSVNRLKNLYEISQEYLSIDDSLLQANEDSINQLILFKQNLQNNINQLTLTNEFLYTRLNEALFFINDTIYIGDEAFFIIDNGTVDPDTVKIYWNKSTYHIVDYIFKNDTIRKYQNDFINEQNTSGITSLLIKADSIQYPSSMIDIIINDTLYRKYFIDDTLNIIPIYKSYSDINKIELELTNNVKTIIEKIGINRFEVEPDVIPPAYIDNDWIIMDTIGAKLIISK